jgi:hypothetical protein
VIVWSLMTEHAPRQSFPIFPAIGGLAALVWLVWLDGKLTWLDARLAWRLRRLSPAKALVALLVVWLATKAVFVHALVPHRNANRQPRAKGELLASLVPAARTLYLFRLKDEGIMFYYGRPVVRLTNPADLPSPGEPVYCILEQSEWEQWSASRPAQALRHLTDEQGAPIVLVRVGG